MWIVAKDCMYVEADEGDSRSKGVLWNKNKV